MPPGADSTYLEDQAEKSITPNLKIGGHDLLFPFLVNADQLAGFR